jgi:hypothetical protein
MRIPARNYTATMKIDPIVLNLLRERARKSQTYSEYILELIQHKEQCDKKNV